MTNAEPNYSKEFGQLVANLRKSSGAKQEGYARRIGKSRSTLANIERGYLPGLEVLEALVAIEPDHADALRTLFNLARVQRGSAPASVRREPQGDDEDPDYEMFYSRSGISPKLEGKWVALWQTTVNEVENINSERLLFKWRKNLLYIENEQPSEDNPKGGYLWKAQCRLFDNQFITGTYSAVAAEVRFKGTIYLVLHGSGTYMLGHWVGCNYDTDWAHGLVAVARDESDLAGLLRRHISAFPSMPYWPRPSEPVKSEPEEHTTDQEEVTE